MLTFVLKRKFFLMFKKGWKDTEYRRKTEYWSKRLQKVRTGDQVKLTLGYTKEHLMARFINVDEIAARHLPRYCRRFLSEEDETGLFYAVKLEVLHG
jgi:hypothetical protein